MSHANNTGPQPANVFPWSLQYHPLLLAKRLKPTQNTHRRSHVAVLIYNRRRSKHSLLRCRVSHSYGRRANPSSWLLLLVPKPVDTADAPAAACGGTGVREASQWRSTQASRVGHESCCSGEGSRGHRPAGWLVSSQEDHSVWAIEEVEHACFG